MGKHIQSIVHAVFHLHFLNVKGHENCNRFGRHCSHPTELTLIADRQAVTHSMLLFPCHFALYAAASFQSAFNDLKVIVKLLIGFSLDKNLHISHKQLLILHGYLVINADHCITLIFDTLGHLI